MNGPSRPTREQRSASEANRGHLPRPTRGAEPAVANREALPAVATLGAAGFAIGLGLLLAIALTVAAGAGADWGPRWRALAQVHGQIMTLGWAGLFVVGMAARLLPRFSGTPLRHPRLLYAAAVLIASGLILRTLVQPFGELPGGRALLVVGGLLFGLGALCFAGSLLATLARPLRERRPFAAFCAAGALWLPVASLLGVWTLARATTGAAFIVSGADEAPLLFAELYGFLLCFMLGVSLRSLPTLFAWKTPAWLAWLAFAALQGGLLLSVGVRLAEAAGGANLWALSAAGRLLFAGGLVAGAGCIGVWRPASRMRDTAQAIALLLRAAYGWLLADAALIAYGAWRGLRLHAETPAAIDDAARHVFALGVVSTLIIGMAYLVGHMFAAERAQGAAMARRVRVYAWLLGAAVVLRAGGALLEERGVLATRYWPMAAAGVLALAALTLFAWRLLWGLRHSYLSERARRP
ncbi:MAG TPA: hypothetical protein VKV26_07305 [Dehalococcoidia bacterium]|nr:hypothetical protein [Dehalococcoidia bacterium]